MKTLYICYFGLREPLVQTQVIPYLREIIKGGVDVSLLTFEPDINRAWSPNEIDQAREELINQGIDWHLLAYHKSPSVPATLYDIANGARYIARLLRGKNFDVLHARVHVPALMATLARKFSRRKPRIIFDIRGFFPEEYTDAGIWPENGWLYRAVKRVERWLLAEADGFVVLTERARDILFPGAADRACDKLGRPVQVIPCCVDIRRFETANDESRRSVRDELGIGDRYVLLYVGSFGGWYLSDEMFDMFEASRVVDASLFILILTQRHTESAVDALRARGFEDGDFHVVSVSPAGIPRFMSAADGAVSFVKPCFSKQASSPTKNAEYLAGGLPIIANTGVGDVDSLITDDRVGVLISEFNVDAYRRAFQELKELGDISKRCRETARQRFDLETIGGHRYRRLYEKLFCKETD